MVGADLAGIELRMLGHYIGRWSSDFAETLLHGDIHQQNAERVGVSRRQIKTITYASSMVPEMPRLGIPMMPN